MARASVSDAPRTPPSGGTPWGPPGRAGGSIRGEGGLGVPAQAAAPATRSRISGRKWMDGWMDIDFDKG